MVMVVIQVMDLEPPGEALLAFGHGFHRAISTSPPVAPENLIAHRSILAISIFRFWVVDTEDAALNA